MDRDDTSAVMFVGLGHAAGSASGQWVCVDELGRCVYQGALPWSASGVQRFLESLRAMAAASGGEVTLGLEDGELAEDISRALCSSGLVVKTVSRWMVEGMWRSHKRRRQTVAVRALCIAQVLWVADCPPGPLALPRAQAEGNR